MHAFVLLKSTFRFSETLLEKKTYHAVAVLNILFPEFTHVPEHLYPTLFLPTHLKLPPSPELSALLNDNTSPLLLISTSYNRDFSFPGIDLYCEVLNRLYEQHPFRVLISCMKQDHISAQIIHHRLKAPSCIAMSRDLGELLQLINLSNLLFIGDGGLMHLAACLNKKQVILFGRTHPWQWLPLTKKAVHFYHLNMLQR